MRQSSRNLLASGTEGSVSYLAFRSLSFNGPNLDCLSPDENERTLQPDAFCQLDSTRHAPRALWVVRDGKEDHPGHSTSSIGAKVGDTDPDLFRVFWLDSGGCKRALVTRANTSAVRGNPFPEPGSLALAFNPLTRFVIDVERLVCPVSLSR